VSDQKLWAAPSDLAGKIAANQRKIAIQTMENQAIAEGLQALEQRDLDAALAVVTDYGPALARLGWAGAR
jgi:hypothetical protein